MGYSQSVALLILVIGIGFALAAVGGPLIDGSSDVASAIGASQDEIAEVKNSDFEIEDVDSPSGEGGFTTVTITNTGSETLRIDEMSVLFDGEVVEPTDVEVEGADDRTLIEPGETAELEFEEEEPDRVKIVFENGVSRVFVV